MLTRTTDDVAVVVEQERVDADGVRERLLSVPGEREAVPTVVWTPADAVGPRPTVLLAHGGGQHKATPGIVAIARELVLRHGLACVAADGPLHGDRVTEEQRERGRQAAREREQARRAASAAGGPPARSGDAQAPYPELFVRGVRDWTAVLDTVQRLPDVGAERVGWWGVSMGTSLGLPFVAGEPRVACAVLGLSSAVPRPGHDQWLAWAQSVRVPLLFLAQRDDGGHPLADALRLFDLFGSADKTLHLNPGPHVAVPVFERDSSVAFFARHLTG